MVRKKNDLRLSEIQQMIANDEETFPGIQTLSISTINRILRKYQCTMKQLYRVPFRRNSEDVKEKRFKYVQVHKI